MGKNISLINLLFVLLPVCSLASEISIEVNLNEKLGEWNRLYQDFAEGGEGDALYLDKIAHYLKATGVRLLRVDTPVNPLGKYKKSFNGSTIYDFTDVDMFIRSVRAMGGEPLLCLAYTPKYLQQPTEDNTGHTKFPKDPIEWQNLIKELVRFVNIEQKLNVRYWEIWNEPNHGSFWSDGMDKYLELYEITARAILEADPTVKIGGPAISAFDMKWIKALVELTEEKNLPLDFLSWHHYNLSAEDYAEHARIAREYLDTIYPNTEIIIDEWNYHWGLVHENDNNICAAHAARTLISMIDAPIDYAPFFEAKDGWHDGDVYWGRWGLFTFNNEPKAAFFVFEMFSKMTDDRVQTIIDLTDVKDTLISSFATLDGNKLRLMAASEYETTKNAKIRLDGLSGNRNFKINRYLIDNGHSNPVYGLPKKLQLAEENVIAQINDKFEMDVIIPPYSVNLFEVYPTKKKTGLMITPAVDTISSLGRMRFRAEIAKRIKIKDITFSGDFSYIEEPKIIYTDDRATIDVYAKANLCVKDSIQFFTANITDEENNKYAATCNYQAKRALIAEPAEILVAPEMKTIVIPLTVENFADEVLTASVTWQKTQGFDIEMPNLLPLPENSHITIEAHTKTTFQYTIDAPEEIYNTTNIVPRLHINNPDVMFASTEIHIVPKYDSYKKTIDIKGNDKQWKDIKRIEMKSFNGASNSEFSVSYDNEFLYFRIKTKDFTHCQIKAASDMWMQDSLQIAIDPQNNATLLSDNKLAGDDLEFGVSLTNDGNIQTYCWHFPEDIDLELFSTINVNIQHKLKNTYYYLAIPWNVLKLNGPANVIGCSLLVNDYDKDNKDMKKKSLSLWGEGIAYSKNPWQFNKIVFH